MYVIRTVIFSREESQAFGRAQRLIDIAYPLASDPLVQRSREAQARAAPEDDPHRRVLRGLGNAFDPVTRPRLVLAKTALDILADQVRKESSVDYWLALSAASADQPTRQMAGQTTEWMAGQMARVLATERTAQLHIVNTALGVVEAALTAIPPQDDPTLIRDQALGM